MTHLYINNMTRKSLTYIFEVKLQLELVILKNDTSAYIWYEWTVDQVLLLCEICHNCVRGSEPYVCGTKIERIFEF